MIDKKVFTMIITIVLTLLFCGGVQSDSSMNMEVKKEMPSEEMPSMELGMMKEKRYLSHHHGLPCPQMNPHFGSHIPQMSYSKLHAVPSYPSKKVIIPNYQPQMYIYKPIQQHGWQYGMQQHQVPMYHQQHWQPKVSQPKVIVQKPMNAYAPMYHHGMMHPSPHYMSSIIKQPIVYQKPIVLVKPSCPPTSCHPQKANVISYHQQPQIKFVHPPPSVSYVKVPVSQPISHSHPHYPPPPPPPPVHVHKFSQAHWVKDICTK